MCPRIHGRLSVPLAFRLAGGWADVASNAAPPALIGRRSLSQNI